MEEQKKKANFQFLKESFLAGWLFVSMTVRYHFSERSYFCAHSHLPHLERGVSN